MEASKIKSMPKFLAEIEECLKYSSGSFCSYHYPKERIQIKHFARLFIEARTNKKWRIVNAKIEERSDYIYYSFDIERNVQNPKSTVTILSEYLEISRCDAYSSPFDESYLLETSRCLDTPEPQQQLGAGCQVLMLR